MPKVLSEAGAAALILLILLLAVVAVVLLLISQGSFKNPLSLQPQQERSLDITLATDYQNPFDKNTQYVNPFSEYKNPFDNLK